MASSYTGITRGPSDPTDDERRMRGSRCCGGRGASTSGATSTVGDVDARADDRLPLQDAADALGVHYQTAYRWVRTGRLPAQLVAGKYVIDRHDLDVLARERDRPRAPVSPSGDRLERQAARFEMAISTGDEPAARSIVQRLVDEGAPLVDVIETVVAPALRSIGDGWQSGTTAIWEEHRASAIVERVLGDISPNPRGRRRGSVVISAVAGDRHALPVTMAGIVLRDDHWHVDHLGADMPPDEIVRFCSANPVDVAVLTVTNPQVAELAHQTATRLDELAVPTVIGRPGGSLRILIDDVRRSARRGRDPGSTQKSD